MELGFPTVQQLNEVDWSNPVEEDGRERVACFMTGLRKVSRQSKVGKISMLEESKGDRVRFKSKFSSDSGGVRGRWDVGGIWGAMDESKQLTEQLMLLQFTVEALEVAWPIIDWLVLLAVPAQVIFRTLGRSMQGDEDIFVLLLQRECSVPLLWLGMYVRTLLTPVGCI